MRVAVTGATGFIGRHLALELATAGHGVVGVSRQAESLPWLEQQCAGDVRDLDTWRCLSAVDAVVHLAGLSDASLSVGAPLEYNTVNAVGTLVGLEAARRLGVVFVLASSQRVYRSRPEPLAEDGPLDPVDPYGFSKLVAERWVAMYRRVFNLPAIVLRFFSVYGPGQMPGDGTSGVVALFTGRALRDEELAVHGEARRDFTYVEDVAAGIRRALEQPRAIGEVYNLATGTGTATEELARLVVQVTGSSSAVRVEPRDKPGESYVADISKATEQLGYQPSVSLRQGLERYAEWLRERR